MFDEIELSNCPSVYALNCRHYQISCHKCKANNTGKYLQYTPINKDINNHPTSIKQKSSPVSNSKKGRTFEKKMIKDIPYLLSTYASGSIGGDGDAYIDLINIGRVRVEIKNRLSESGNIYPTAKEYRESAAQNIDIILVRHVILRETYVYMTFKLFIKIWKTFIFHESIICHNYTYKYGELYDFYKTGLIPYGESMPKYNYYLLEEKNSPINVFKNYYKFKYETIVIYRKSIGQYVMMHQDTLTELIELYKNIQASNN